MKQLAKAVPFLVLNMMSVAVAAENVRPYLKSGQALAGVEACQARATEKGWSVAIVILDRGLDVVAALRMDETLPSAYDVAVLKAETALFWSASTTEVRTMVEAQPEFNDFPRTLAIGGGEPIYSESGKLIGAVGVAGSYVADDEVCAQAVVNALSHPVTY